MVTFFKAFVKFLHIKFLTILSVALSENFKSLKIFTVSVVHYFDSLSRNTCLQLN